MPNDLGTNRDYDPRWFIWTIVFLVVVGISLVSYIFLSEPVDDYSSNFVKTKTAQQK